MLISLLAPGISTKACQMCKSRDATASNTTSGFPLFPWKWVGSFSRQRPTTFAATSPSHSHDMPVPNSNSWIIVVTLHRSKDRLHSFQRVVFRMLAVVSLCPNACFYSFERSWSRFLWDCPIDPLFVIFSWQTVDRSTLCDILLINCGSIYSLWYPKLSK